MSVQVKLWYPLRTRAIPERALLWWFQEEALYQVYVSLRLPLPGNKVLELWLAKQLLPWKSALDKTHKRKTRLTQIYITDKSIKHFTTNREFSIDDHVSSTYTYWCQWMQNNIHYTGLLTPPLTHTWLPQAWLKSVKIYLVQRRTITIQMPYTTRCRHRQQYFKHTNPGLQCATLTRQKILSKERW